MRRTTVRGALASALAWCCALAVAAEDGQSLALLTVARGIEAREAMVAAIRGTLTHRVCLSSAELQEQVSRLEGASPPGGRPEPDPEKLDDKLVGPGLLKPTHGTSALYEVHVAATQGKLRYDVTAYAPGPGHWGLTANEGGRLKAEETSLTGIGDWARFMIVHDGSRVHTWSNSTGTGRVRWQKADLSVPRTPPIAEILGLGVFAGVSVADFLFSSVSELKGKSNAPLPPEGLVDIVGLATLHWSPDGASYEVVSVSTVPSDGRSDHEIVLTSDDERFRSTWAIRVRGSTFSPSRLVWALLRKGKDDPFTVTLTEGAEWREVQPGLEFPFQVEQHRFIAKPRGDDAASPALEWRRTDIYDFATLECPPLLPDSVFEHTFSPGTLVQDSTAPLGSRMHRFVTGLVDGDMHGSVRRHHGEVPATAERARESIESTLRSLQEGP